MVAFMSGILALIREFLLIHRPDRINEKFLFWRCVMIAFILSSATLWILEHHQTLALQSTLDQLTKPYFVVESQNQASGCSDQSTLTFLGVRITNNGADSAVSDYEAYYDSETLNSTKVKTVYLPGRTLKLKYPSGSWYEIPSSGILYNKTGVIHRGDFIVGRLPLEIPGNRCKELADPKTRITVKVKDYLGNWYSGYFQGVAESSSEPQMMQGELMPVPTEQPQKKEK
jgi:hypothetical protein